MVPGLPEQQWSPQRNIYCGAGAYVFLLAQSFCESQRNLLLKSCSATHPCLPWSLRVSSVSKCSTKGLHLPTSPPRQAPGFHKNQSDDCWPGALQVSPTLKPELCQMASAGKASQCPMDSSGDPAWVKDDRCQALFDTLTLS